MSPKPEFIIVPGAWHPPSSFSPTTTLLEAAGYTVHGISLPSVGASPHLSDFAPDVTHIRSVLNSVLASGKDVIMIYHSYGGAAGSEALAPYVEELEKGVQKEGWGKVRRLVYCCSFALPKGGSLMRALGFKDLPWFIVEGDEVRPDTPEVIFYKDLTPEQLEIHVASLKPHSYRTFYSEVSVEPYKVIPSTYILCENDLAIPIRAQQGMVAAAGEGVFEVERCDASHSPFISQPDWLAGVLIRLAGGAEV